jgi:hypothetical protein
MALAVTCIFFPLVDNEHVLLVNTCKAERYNKVEQHFII